MTTIAYRDGIMVADSQLTDRGVCAGQVRKIAKSPDGGLIGCCGSLHELHILHQWMEAGACGKPPAIVDEGSEALLVRPDGTVHWIGHAKTDEAYLVEISDVRYHAAGSGYKLAIGAMAAGASAEEALRICCELECYTGLPLQIELLG